MLNNKTGIKVVDKNGKEIEGAVLDINQTYLLNKIKKHLTEEAIRDFYKKTVIDIKDEKQP
jgi:hypothetical protein